VLFSVRITESSPKEPTTNCSSLKVPPVPDRMVSGSIIYATADVPIRIGLTVDIRYLIMRHRML